MSTGILDVCGLTKVYPGTVALDGFSARFDPGKVHALIGRNGSGKSTLVRILAGADIPTSGSVSLGGRRVLLRTPRDAFRAGIATVHQELSLIPELTVAENVFLGRLPRRRGRVDWRAVRAQTRTLLDDLRMDVPETARAGDLSVGRQQMVEIARAMSFSPAVLLLDEPTSALARHETQSLFRLLGPLRQRGVTILYITHRMHELPRIADDVTVLRDGRCTGTLSIAEATAERIVACMYGRGAHTAPIRDTPAHEETVLSVSGLSRRPWFDPVSFSVRRGEILGIAGMLGAGRTELLRAIFGADRRDEGEIRVNGRAASRTAGPVELKRLGLGLTPENRKEEGLVQRLSIRANMSMAAMNRIARAGWITRRGEAVAARRQIADLDIKTGSLENPVSSLSGGNQQKVLLGNWLANEPSVLLLDEPTRGVDLHAKRQIFQIMRDLARRGLACVFVSTELEELLEVCHRILVMVNGRMVAERDAGALSLEELYGLCMDAPMGKECTVKSFMGKKSMKP